MKKFIISCIIVAVCTACGGGSSVDKAISQVEKAIVKVEKNKGKMIEEDCKNLEKEVEAPLKVISDALENDKVGVVGKMKILAVSAKWATVLATAGVKELEKQTGVAMEDWGKELEKAGKELEKNGITEELEKAAKELEKSGSTEEFEKAAKELEKAAQELKEKMSQQ
jgi:hypothetical protein